MTWLGFALVAFLAAGWLVTALLLAFTRGERDGLEAHLGRLAAELADVHDPATWEQAVEQARREGRP